MTRRIGVGLYSTLAEKDVHHVFFEPIKDIHSHLENICNNPGPVRLAVVHDAGNMVLRA